MARLFVVKLLLLAVTASLTIAASAASQGTLGRTSTATAKITLHIHDHAQGQSAHTVEARSAGFQAVQAYCAGPATVNDSVVFSLADPHNNAIRYHIDLLSAQTADSQRLAPDSARALLDTLCGHRTAGSGTAPTTLLVAPL